MLKHTKSQVNEFCFPKWVLLSCFSPQFVCYFLFSEEIFVISFERSVSETNLKEMLFLDKAPYRVNSPLSHGGHIVRGDQKSFVLPRRASQSKPWGRG